MSPNKPNSEIHVEDLSIQQRRGCLSARDRDNLQCALASDPLLHLSHQAGLDFDHLASVQPGDDALIARSIQSVVLGATAPSKMRSRRWRSACGVLAAALVVGGVAAARGGPAWRAISASALGRSSQQNLAQSRPALVNAGSLQPAKVPPFESTTLPTQDATSDTRTSQLSAPSVQSAPRLRSERRRPLDVSSPLGDTPPAEPLDTAAGLFERASSARLAGDAASAIALFGQLQSRFPRSEEALVACVSLGRLLLANAQPAQALLQFRRYRQTGGALNQEAMVGSAESLMRLDQVEDERRVWRQLLEQYPNSIYGARARERLAEPETSAGRLPKPLE